MDDQTTFWIAQQVADTKYTYDIRPGRVKVDQQKKQYDFVIEGQSRFRERYQEAECAASV